MNRQSRTDDLGELRSQMLQRCVQYCIYNIGSGNARLDLHELCSIISVTRYNHGLYIMKRSCAYQLHRGQRFRIRKRDNNINIISSILLGEKLIFSSMNYIMITDIIKKIIISL